MISFDKLRGQLKDLEKHKISLQFRAGSNRDRILYSIKIISFSEAIHTLEMLIKAKKLMKRLR